MRTQQDNAKWYTRRDYQRHPYAWTIDGGLVNIPVNPRESMNDLLRNYGGLSLGESTPFDPYAGDVYHYGISHEVDSDGVPIGIVCAADLGDRYAYAILIRDGRNGADRILSTLPDDITNGVQWGEYDGATFAIVDGWDSIRKIGAYLKTLPAYAEELATVDNDRVLDRVMVDAWGFSDEYTVCSECANVIRTSPDSYSWQANYWLSEDSILCSECTRANAHAYLAWGNHANRLVNPDVVNPADHEFTKLEESYENGLHHGQNDDPRAILRAVKDLRDQVDVIFTGDTGQFDVRFYVWARWTESYRAQQEDEDTPLLDDVAADLVAGAIDAAYKMPSVGPADYAMDALRQR